MIFDTTPPTEKEWDRFHNGVPQGLIMYGISGEDELYGVISLHPDQKWYSATTEDYETMSYLAVALKCVNTDDKMEIGIQGGTFVRYDDGAKTYVWDWIIKDWEKEQCKKTGIARGWMVFNPAPSEYISDLGENSET